MSSSSGWARLTVVFVVIIEMILLAGTYHAWTELSEAEQRLASLPVPPDDNSQSMSEYFDEVASSSSDEIVQRSAESEARFDYQYTAASVETKKGELYLYIGSLFAVPLAIALIYQGLFWIGRGFRRQPV